MVYLGFPFETITSASARNAYTADVLRFFSKRPDLAIARSGNNITLTLNGEPGLDRSPKLSKGIRNSVPVQ